MSFTNRCGVLDSSPYCVCTDYYGNILPEYKYYDEVTLTYSCCNNLVNHTTLSNPDTIDDNDSNLVNFAKGSNNVCSDFYTENTITTNSDLKNFPLIYYQSLLNAGLFNTFNTLPTLTSNEITCNTGIPYFVSYPNYSNNETNYKLVCGSSNSSEIQNIKFIGSDVEIPYSVNYVKNSDGKNCLLSTCTTKYDTLKLNEYNIGDRLYKSKGSIDSKNVALKWWFWFILLIAILAVVFASYYYYQHHMHKHFHKSANYLNSIKQGLGDTAKIHSKKVYKSHFHMNT